MNLKSSEDNLRDLETKATIIELVTNCNQFDFFRLYVLRQKRV